MVKAPKLAIVIAIAGPLAVIGAAESSAAPINGVAIKAAAPAVKTEVRYRAQSAQPYWDYPTYSYWGYRPYYYRNYPAYWSYSPYWTYPNYYNYSYGW